MRAGGARGRRPLRAHRAGLACMGYGGHMARMAVTTRADAVALDAADPLAAFRDRFVLGDGRRIYVDGNSLGRAGTRRPGGARGPHRRVGRPARHGLARLGRRTGRRSATGSPRPRSAPGRAQVIVSDSTTVNLYKLAVAALDARPGAIVCRPGRLPHRPVRAPGAERPDAARAADARRRSRRRAAAGRGRAGVRRRRGAGRAVGGELPLGLVRPHGRDHGRRRTPRAPSSCGISATRPGPSRSTSTRSAPTWPSAAPTST